MTATDTGSPLLRWTPQLIVLLVLAAGVWVVTLDRAGDMAGMAAMSPTMGLGLGAFAGMWALMMTAMMLPSVAPFAVLYSRTFTRRRAVRLTLFTASYLVSWALAAVPAWLVLRAVDGQLASGRSGTLVASLVLGTAGVWQLSPLKQRCLRHCRSPLGQLLHYGAYTGMLRDVRVAVHHSMYCLGCCWGLMALFVVTGVMHVGAMVVLTGVVAAEKLLPRGETLTAATGILALVAAVAVWWLPTLAPGLT